ncbi:3',5'-cyclic adenosine monophosphate phosphodiesterase CpdA [Methanimicrococcus stummii]|uniref:DNA double-strand break repair protein Mre11 n=1 Tax=Methanimicrococcus stummii TaxID=3028294 RepID=A0AA96VKM7_9EURY|nr:exonuclease SbcCD subunit D [Methanimicrococcus sp. Es2]WNY28097.1 3',5'-cyclic adenosine monophosphate phosphodiesterase CpdA [Methanimicrococcus sp. Es2]
MKNTSIHTVEKSEIRILHTGDTHLGSRQYHSDIRRRDFFDSFEKVIADAIENEMDAVIHSGDLFDNRNPTIEDLIDTIAILTPLKKVGIPFLGIVGNHEGKQNTQWLDIFQSMGLAERLGSDPVIVEGPRAQIRFYGVDNLSGPRLAAFDFSVFDANPNYGGDGKKIYNVLTLHQLLDPVLPGQPLSCDDFTSAIPIPFDAVLLGDNHKYECIKHNGAWLTYPGSTERCSAAESEPRAYNILTFDGADISITRRTIPTRDFVTIPVQSDDSGEIQIDEIYSKIDSYSEKINGAVVFIEFSGVKKTLIPISEIEEYVKSKGAIVARVGDKRDLEKDEDDSVKQIVFRDPDEVVTQELRKLNLTEAGLLLDSIIRDSETTKTNVADVSEDRLKEYLGNHDFKDEFRRDSVYFDEDESTDENQIDVNDLIETAGLIDRNAAEQAVSVEETPVEETKIDNEISNQTDETEENLMSPETEPESKPVSQKEKPNSRPRQYTLGDMFGAEESE